MKKTFFLLLIFINIILCGCDNKAKLRYDPNGNFSILADLNFRMKGELITSDKPFYLYSYSYEKDNYILTISFYPIVEEPLNVPCEDDMNLDNGIGGASENSNSIIQYIKKIDYKKYSGREYELSGKDVKLKSHMYIINDTVYLLSAETKKMNNSFDISLVNDFFNSFSKKIDENPSPCDNLVDEKNPILSCSNLEKYLVSNLTYIDYDITKRGWNKLGELTRDKYGKGYQYTYKSNDDLFQLIIFPDVIALLYVPNDSNYLSIEKEVKAKYTFQEILTIEDQKQYIYHNSINRIHLCPDGPNKMINVFWGMGESKQE